MAEINRWSVVMAAHATESHIHTPNKPSYMHNSIQHSLLFMPLAILKLYPWLYTFESGKV